MEMLKLNVEWNVPVCIVLVLCEGTVEVYLINTTLHRMSQESE